MIANAIDRLRPDHIGSMIYQIRIFTPFLLFVRGIIRSSNEGRPFLNINGVKIELKHESCRYLILCIIVKPVSKTLQTNLRKILFSSVSRS